MPNPKTRNAFSAFLYNNSLTLFFVALFFVSIIGQIYTGLHEHNDFLEEKGAETIGVLPYLSSGHFLESTFENWESEFLQMAFFIIFSVWLRQKGSSDPNPSTKRMMRTGTPAFPGGSMAVRKGGLILKFISNHFPSRFCCCSSFRLFCILRKLKDYNLTQSLEHNPWLPCNLMLENLNSGLSRFRTTRVNLYQ
jgi:hypothetical protein